MCSLFVLNEYSKINFMNLGGDEQSRYEDNENC